MYYVTVIKEAKYRHHYLKLFEQFSGDYRKKNTMNQGYHSRDKVATSDQSQYTQITELTNQSTMVKREKLDFTSDWLKNQQQISFRLFKNVNVVRLLQYYEKRMITSQTRNRPQLGKRKDLYM